MDSDGGPIAAAPLELRAAKPHIHRPDMKTEAELAREIEEEIASFRTDRALSREVRTDAAGRFEFGKLAPGEYELEARPPGFEAIARRVAGGATIRIVCARVASIEVDVLLPDGTPASRAYVSVDRADSHAWPAVRRIDTWRGKHELVATATITDPGGVESACRSDPVVVMATEGGPPARVTLRTSLRPLLRVTIAAIAGEPLSRDVVLCWAHVPDGLQPGPEWFDVNARRERIDEGPFFETSDVIAGTYMIGLAYHSGPSFARESTEVRGRGAEVTVRVPALDRREAVTLKVIGPSGPTPYESASVEATEGDTRWSVTHDVDFQLVPPLDRAPGPRTTPLHVSVAARFGDREIEIPAGITEATVRFEEPALIDVVIADCQDPSRVEVSLRRDEASRHQREHVRVDADGTARFSAVQPGAYELAVDVQPLGGDVLPAVRRAVQIGPGTGEIAVSVPLHTITVDFAGVGDFIVVPADARNYMYFMRSPIAASGRTILSHLPSATYRLEFHPRGPSQPTSAMRFTVPGPAELPFVPDPALSRAAGSDR